MAKQILSIIGGGPAGSAAALSALMQGVPVRIFEPARFPRHKVCGEFLSPQIAGALDDLGVLQPFLNLGPALCRRIALNLPKTTRRHQLSEPAFGLSRYQLDRLLLDGALARGAELIPERAVADQFRGAVVVAHGRKSNPRPGRRLFGFKAHFEGPFDDSVELFFFNSGYVGVNAVEGGRTNVCGIATEEYLRLRGWSFDEVLDTLPGMRSRMNPMSRCTSWSCTGPLEFGEAGALEREQCYPAGDALSFVDPFTGSGIVAAILTGTLAAKQATSGNSVAAYLRNCWMGLKVPYFASAIVRIALQSRWADTLARWAPVGALVRVTRPFAYR